MISVQRSLTFASAQLSQACDSRDFRKRATVATLASVRQSRLSHACSKRRIATTFEWKIRVARYHCCYQLLEAFAVTTWILLLRYARYTEHIYALYLDQEKYMYTLVYLDIPWYTLRSMGGLYLAVVYLGIP